MQKLPFKATAAVLGLFIAGEVASADTVSPSTGAQPAPASAVIPAAHGGGHGGFGGGGGRGGGGFAFGGGAGIRGGGPGLNGGRAFGSGPGFRGGGRSYAFDGRGGYGRGRRGYYGYGYGPFVGFGYDYPYYGGGSCYWNCRNSGFGPSYCSAYAFNFC